MSSYKLPSPKITTNALIMSPLQAIISRLPSPISVKRVSHSSPSSSPSPSHKRSRSNDSSAFISSPDVRRQMLIKKVQEKLAVGGECKASNETVELDDSVQIIADNNENESSFSLEERDNTGKENSGKQDESKPEQLVEGLVDDMLNATAKVSNKEVNIKKNEVRWCSVKRIKRKSRLFLFGGSFDGGEKDEIFVIKAEGNEKVPWGINGRRPFLVVPGVEYDLEEGEGVMINTEEEETEIRLARNEKYEMDSFVCNPGYLSDEEMMETPTMDKVISKVKQQRRANNIQAKLKFEKLGEPEVLGCLWWTGKGGQKQKMRKWQAMVFTTTPIPTSYTMPVPVDQLSPQVQVLPSAPVVTTNQVDQVNLAPPTMSAYLTKYHIKYLVKNLARQALLEQVGPNQCSTPMPGQFVSSKASLTPSALVAHIMEQDSDDVLANNKNLVEKYAVKYFYKFKF